MDRDVYEHMDDSSPPPGPSSRGAASSTTDSESRARPSSTIADKMFFSLYIFCIIVCSEFQHCEQNGQFIKEIRERKIGETLSRLGSSLDPGW